MKKPIFLFDNEGLEIEENDIKTVLKLAREGKDLEYIADELSHLHINQLVMICLDQCFKGKLRKFYLQWDT